MAWSESSSVVRLLSRAGSRDVVETAIDLSKQRQTTWEPIRSVDRAAPRRQGAKNRPQEVAPKKSKK